MNDYITRRYGPSANRNWWGIAHRRWLLDSGRYVRSGEQRSARAGMPAGFRMVLENGPELVDLSGGVRVYDEAEAMRRLTCDCA